MYLPKSGQANATQFKQYDSCVVQTQREGRCGGTPRSSGNTRPTQRQQDPDQQRPSSSDLGAGTVPCGGRCPISECVDVNGSGRDYQCRMDIINGTTQTNANDCTSQYTEILNECTGAIEETNHTCDEKNDSGMTGVANTASQLGLMLGQQTSSSIQSACSQMASYSAAANAAVAAYRLNCNNSLGTCRSTCRRLVEFVESNPTCTIQGYQSTVGQNAAVLNNAESKVERCDQFESKVQEATQAINNVANTMQNASRCATETSGTAAAIPEICKTNPNLPGCVASGPVDCTNPDLAGTKVCVCSKNPNDPICMNENTQGGGSTYYSSTNPGARLNSMGSDFSGGDLPSLPGIEHGARGSGGSGEAVDGKMGGSAGISSSGDGGGGAAAGAGGGAAEAEEDGSQSVNAGFYGGGGSFGGYGAGGKQAAAGRPGQLGKGAVPGKNGAPDLRQFLPGGKFDPKARGLAGAGGPDGITGPHSNIWKKIQNRYQVLTPTLMP